MYVIYIALTACSILHMTYDTAWMEVMTPENKTNALSYIHDLLTLSTRTTNDSKVVVLCIKHICFVQVLTLSHIHEPIPVDFLNL